MTCWQFCLLLAIVLTSPPNDAAAANAASAAPFNFKVESIVDRGDVKYPISQSTTLFSGEKVYDFLNVPHEITIVSWKDNCVILLNPRQNEQAELSFDAVLQFEERIKSRIQRENGPHQRSAADPHFEVEVEPLQQRVILKSSLLTYRITIRDDVDLEIVQAFLRFSNLMARVNCLLVQGSRLPGPRLKVNQVLAERNFFPQDVTLFSPPKNFLEWLPGRRPVIRSTHTLTIGLTDEDRARIAEAERWSREFRRVSFIDYQANLAEH
ncbi:MAG: hypothetical protein ACUVQG_03390 [Thermogutta sp.]